MLMVVCGAFVSDIMLLSSLDLFSNTNAEDVPYQIGPSENMIATFASFIRVVLNRFSCIYIS